MWPGEQGPAPAASDDSVESACAAIAYYLDRLEELAPEPLGPDGSPVPVHARLALAGEPYGPAGRMLMTILEGIRRLETSLLRDTAGDRPRLRRGMTAENTAQVLDALPKLAAGLTQAEAELAEEILSEWISGSRSVPGIDENPRWRHLPRALPETGLPAQCPYCGLFYLLYDPDAAIVACSVPGCADTKDGPPVASVTTDASGLPILAWADGKVQAAPDLGDEEQEEAG